MIVLIYGTDRDAVLKEKEKILSQLRAKKPNAEEFIIGGDQWNTVDFEALIPSQGLFEKKSIVTLRGVLGVPENIDLILSKLEELKESENAFVFVEEKVPAAVVKNFEKYAHSVKKFEQKVDFRDKDPFPAGLVDAFGSRDKKQAWLELVKKYRAGVPAEELHGALFWQVKSIILASGSASAAEAGMKDYPYSKSKSFAKNYSESELKELSSKLVSVYHDAHRGMGELDTALERFVLSL